jgi:hypothetical protein
VLDVGLTTVPRKNDSCWEASKKFSWIESPKATRQEEGKGLALERDKGKKTVAEAKA